MACQTASEEAIPRKTKLGGGAEVANSGGESGRGTRRPRSSWVCPETWANAGTVRPLRQILERRSRGRRTQQNLAAPSEDRRVFSAFKREVRPVEWTGGRNGPTRSFVAGEFSFSFIFFFFFFFSLLFVLFNSLD